MHFLRKVQADLAEGEEGHWGIIDILTLLLVFFIILYVNEIKESPASAAAEVREEHSPGRYFSAGDPVDIEGYFSGYAREGFSFVASDREVTLILEEKLSFAPGRAELAGDSHDVLGRVVVLLKQESGYDAVISGHTDDRPISNSEFRSNWHLATARAVAVAEYLLVHGVAPQRLTTQGFAEYRPLTANDSEAGRGKNRRVEIILRKKG